MHSIMFPKRVLVVVVCIIIIVQQQWMLRYVESHGYMETPVPRSRLWRYLSFLEPNYDDNGLNCNYIHSNPEQIQCSECGGAWQYNSCNDELRNIRLYNRKLKNRHNNTNIFAYRANGGFNVSIRLTTIHLGHFYFEVAVNVCAQSHDNRPLYHSVGAGTSVLANVSHYIVQIDYERLPFECSRGGRPCILRWTYVGGNNWGCSPAGTPTNVCGMGKGAQEIFRNCADFFVR